MNNEQRKYIADRIDKDWGADFLDRAAIRMFESPNDRDNAVRAKYGKFIRGEDVHPDLKGNFILQGDTPDTFRLLDPLGWDWGEPADQGKFAAMLLGEVAGYVGGDRLGKLKKLGDPKRWKEILSGNILAGVGSEGAGHLGEAWALDHLGMDTGEYEGKSLTHMGITGGLTSVLGIGADSIPYLGKGFEYYMGLKGYKKADIEAVQETMRQANAPFYKGQKTVGYMRKPVYEGPGGERLAVEINKHGLDADKDMNLFLDKDGFLMKIDDEGNYVYTNAAGKPHKKGSGAKTRGHPKLEPIENTTYIDRDGRERHIWDDPTQPIERNTPVASLGTASGNKKHMAQEVALTHYPGNAEKIQNRINEFKVGAVDELKKITDTLPHTHPSDSYWSTDAGFDAMPVDLRRLIQDSPEWQALRDARLDRELAQHGWLKNFEVSQQVPNSSKRVPLPIYDGDGNLVRTGVATMAELERAARQGIQDLNAFETTTRNDIRDEYIKEQTEEWQRVTMERVREAHKADNNGEAISPELEATFQQLVKDTDPPADVMKEIKEEAIEYSAQAYGDLQKRAGMAEGYLDSYAQAMGYAQVKPPRTDPDDLTPWAKGKGWDDPKYQEAHDKADAFRASGEGIPFKVINAETARLDNAIMEAQTKLATRFQDELEQFQSQVMAQTISKAHTDAFNENNLWNKHFITNVLGGRSTQEEFTALFGVKGGKIPPYYVKSPQEFGSLVKEGLGVRYNKINQTYNDMLDMVFDYVANPQSAQGQWLYRNVVEGKTDADLRKTIELASARRARTDAGHKAKDKNLRAIDWSKGDAHAVPIFDDSGKDIIGKKFLHPQANTPLTKPLDITTSDGKHIKTELASPLPMTVPLTKEEIDDALKQLAPDPNSPAAQQFRKALTAVAEGPQTLEAYNKAYKALREQIKGERVGIMGMLEGEDRFIPNAAGLLEQRMMDIIENLPDEFMPKGGREMLQNAQKFWEKNGAHNARIIDEIRSTDSDIQVAERVFTDMEDGPRLLRSLKISLPVPYFDTLRSSVIDRMGFTGQNGQPLPEFSPRDFIRNWDNLPDSVKGLLTRNPTKSGGKEGLNIRDALDAFAEVVRKHADMENAIEYNKSGGIHAGVAMLMPLIGGGAGAVAAGASGVGVMATAGIGLAGIGGRMVMPGYKRWKLDFLTNPETLKWVADGAKINIGQNPKKWRGHVARLGAIAVQDPELLPAIWHYMNELGGVIATGTAGASPLQKTADALKEEVQDIPEGMLIDWLNADVSQRGPDMDFMRQQIWEMQP